jgi:hypothetical protein
MSGSVTVSMTALVRRSGLSGVGDGHGGLCARGFCRSSDGSDVVDDILNHIRGDRVLPNALVHLEGKVSHLPEGRNLGHRTPQSINQSIHQTINQTSIDLVIVRHHHAFHLSITLSFCMAMTVCLSTTA